MKCLVVNPDGRTSFVEKLLERDVQAIVGSQYVTLQSEDGNWDVLIHELSVVADLPINAYVSLKTGLIVGGVAILVPRINGLDTLEEYSPKNQKAIQERNADKALLDRLTRVLEQNREQSNFVFYEPDRWLYNGKVFKAIVVSQSTNQSSKDVPSHTVWFFAGNSNEPFVMRIVEFSMREVLEGMILGDREASEGNPPEHFKAPLSHFGLL